MVGFDNLIFKPSQVEGFFFYCILLNLGVLLTINQLKMKKLIILIVLFIGAVGFAQEGPYLIEHMKLELRVT